MLDTSGPEVAAALRVLTYCEGSAAFFCKVGKDRTGLVAALSLSVAGVSAAAIVDYARSDKFGAVALGGAKIDKAEGIDYSVFKRAPADVMEHVLTYIDSSYGGVPRYLDSIGFGEQERLRLAKRLCD